MDILYLSPADWHGVRGRFQHLAGHLAAAGHRVLYCDGLGVRTLRLRDLPRVADKLRRAFSPSPAAPPEGADGPPPGVELAHPLALPLPRTAPIRAINRAWLRGQLQRALARHRLQPELIWISYPHPDLVALLALWPQAWVVYDCVDSWPDFQGVYPDLAAAEAALLRRAQLVLATAPALVERLSSSHPRVHHVPNGVDMGRFSPRRASPLPKDLAAIPGPRVGFLGNLAHWVDMDLIQALARRLPEVSFVLVGPWQRSEPPPRLSNLHLLGGRPYAAVPSYLAGFDVGLIPFEDSPLTRAVDPLKLYEYLAAGLPVISTPLPAVDPRLAKQVCWIEGVDQALSVLPALLAEDGAVPRERRRGLAARHDWSQRLAAIDAFIQAAGGPSLTTSGVLQHAS